MLTLEVDVEARVAAGQGLKELLDAVRRRVEREAFHFALRQTEGNQRQAARLLRVSERQVYFLLDRHGRPANGAT